LLDPSGLQVPSQHISPLGHPKPSGQETAELLDEESFDELLEPEVLESHAGLHPALLPVATAPEYDFLPHSY
jgi:hypothetical protein